MIVIVGSPAWRSAPPSGPAGRACDIAVAAAARGSRVELVGRVGEDAVGETLLIALANARVGHAAVLRDPLPTTILDPEPVASFDEDALPLLDTEASSPLMSRARGGGGAVARLEDADVDLAIKYLEPNGVMVVTDDVPADALAAAVTAADYAQLRLILLVAPGDGSASALPANLPDDVTVLAAPEDADEAGAFATLVGGYAAALDAGASPAEAFADAQGTTGWEAVAPD